ILNSDTVSDATNELLAPGVPLGAAIQGLNAPDTRALGAYIDNSANLSKFTQEIRVSSAGTNFLDWQVGGYFTHEIGRLNQHLNAVTLPDLTDFVGGSLEIP